MHANALKLAPVWCSKHSCRNSLVCSHSNGQLSLQGGLRNLHLLTMCVAVYGTLAMAYDKRALGTQGIGLWTMANALALLEAARAL